MIARFSGGLLGLLAFGVSVLTGLVVGNPPEVILTRALWALVIFCIVGLAVGAAAQAVINDYLARKSAEVLPTESEKPQDAESREAPPAGAEPAGMD